MVLNTLNMPYMAGACIILLILEICKLEIKENTYIECNLHNFAYSSEPANICKSLFTPPQKKLQKHWSISKDTYRNKTYGVITPP